MRDPSVMRIAVVHRIREILFTMFICCPLCRAENGSSPTCRRCKADLSMLVSLVARRNWLFDQAMAAWAQGRRKDAFAFLQSAGEIRQDAELHKRVAVLSLLEGDFASAFRERQRATASSHR
jgi:hypothetical protein